MAISVQERRASQQAAERTTQQSSRGCHQVKRVPNLYDMETFGGEQSQYSSPAETWEPNPQSPALPFRRSGRSRHPSVDASRLFTPIKRRLPHSTKTVNSESSTAPMAKKARTPSQEPEGSEYRTRLLSVDTLLQQPTALSPPHHRYVQQPTPQPVQHQVHCFVPSPSNSPIPSSLVASRAFPPPCHQPSMYPPMQSHRCSASPQSRLISCDEGSSPIMPIGSVNTNGNPQSGQHANTGSNSLYGQQSNRRAKRGSVASSASNSGAVSLDRQPEERLSQEASIDVLSLRLQSLTPESREEEFGQLDAVTLKKVFDSSDWCKEEIQKSANAKETLLAAIGERDRSEPSGSGRACYYCYEKYGDDRFGKDQPAYAILKANGNYRPFNKKRKYPESVNIESLRQFCMDCGVRLHFYRRYRRFDSETGAVWWACRCRVLRPVVDDEDEPCPDCNCVCPLRNPDEEDDTFESDESDGSDP